MNVHLLERLQRKEEERDLGSACRIVKPLINFAPDWNLSIGTSGRPNSGNCI